MRDRAPSPPESAEVSAPASVGPGLRGYLVTPPGAGPHPGVVIIHEVFGLNDQIRGVARRIAAEGYAALAVDLFSGRNRALCMARILGSAAVGRDSYGVRDLAAALDFLVSQPEVDADQVGAIGFCMGGGLAIAWARRERRLRAIAPFYATNPRPLRALRRLCPVVASYPGEDFTARSGRKLELRLEKLRVTHDIKIYPGAKHSFFNEERRSHDPLASADAWERTLEFFATHVR